MPTVEFSFSELCEFLNKKFEPKDLENEISMLGVDLEKIDKERVVMEVFPNRPDLLGIEGFARALKGVLNIEKGLVNYPLFTSEVELFVEKSVEKVRPYISSVIIKNITINDQLIASLMNIQEKLHLTHGRNRKKVAIGVHDFSKITPPFTYKAVSPTEISFVPLDMAEKMNLKEILEKHPKGKNYAFILEGSKVYPIILDSKKEVISFPPIINGELTRVTEKTKDFFIDVTGLHESSVEKALNILIASIIDRQKSAKAYSVEIIKR